MKKYKSIKVECPNCRRVIEFAIEGEGMEKRKIEVTELGEKHPANVHDDRIAVEFSPSEIEWMGFAFMEAEERNKKIFKILEEAHGVWEEKRSEVDQGSTP